MKARGRISPILCRARAAIPGFRQIGKSWSRGGLPQKGNFSMEITGIKAGHLAAGKASFKKGWKLTDSLREKITALAKEDAAQNVYMGNQFLALRKSEVAKAAPDRAALIGRMDRAMSGDMADMKKIREADERWLCILFGEPYEAGFQSEGTVTKSLHILRAWAGMRRSRRRRRKCMAP